MFPLKPHKLRLANGLVFLRLLLRVALLLNSAPTRDEQNCSETPTWRANYSIPRLPANPDTLPIQRTDYRLMVPFVLRTETATLAAEGILIS